MMSAATLRIVHAILKEGSKMATIKTLRINSPIAAALICALALTTHAAGAQIEKKQQDIRTMSQNTLQALYKADPDSKAIVEKSAGYAVFTNLGVKILVAGSGNGKGVAFDNKTKRETFMKMIELQAGFGMGIKKFQVIFVFDNIKAFNSFVNSGWQFGGQSTVAAKTSNKGAAMAGAVSVSDGVWVYQLTDKGIALELTAKSTKYYKDDDLN
jgi:lipid-binding SYLF domain-containing protein